MRKIAFTIPVLIVLTGLFGADLRRSDTPATKKHHSKKPCYGYTIIEFGKGIDCNGDTVKLVKVNGGQALRKFDKFLLHFELAKK